MGLLRLLGREINALNCTELHFYPDGGFSNTLIYKANE